jgi:hypothetical protein
MSREKFIVMMEWCNSFEQLSNEEMGILFKNFISYNRNENVDNSNRVVNAIWNLIEPNVERINHTYDTNGKNGTKGGAPKGNNNAKKQPKNNPITTEILPNNNPITTEIQPTDKPKTTYKEKDKDKEKEKDNDKEINNIHSTNILGDLERKKFRNYHIQEIEHIRNVSDVSLDEAIDIHYDFVQATNSIFG